MTNESKRSEGYRGAHLLYAFIGGAIAGAVTMLLTAPASGEETRKMLRATGQKGRDAAGNVPEALKAAGIAAEQAFVAAIAPEASATNAHKPVPHRH